MTMSEGGLIAMLQSVVAGLVVSVFVAVSASASQAETLPVGPFLDLKFHSKALEHNLLGDSADQHVLVFLPRNYSSSPNKRYPVVYFLHGFDLVTALGDYGPIVRKAVGSAMPTRTVADMIIVIPNGQNKLYGSYYVNSSVTGNWEDYISRDVVYFIDHHFRTIPNAASRGIAGHSMGGFGAISIAMDHPDVFGAVFAESPCCLAFDPTGTYFDTAWRTVMKFHSIKDVDQAAQHGAFMPVALAAWSAAGLPNPHRPPMMWDLPVRENNGRLVTMPEVMSRWIARMPINRIVSQRTNLMKLRAFRIEYGMSDEFRDIPPSSLALAKALVEAHIPVTLATFTGNHDDHLVERIQTKMLPFFSENLEHQ